MVLGIVHGGRLLLLSMLKNCKLVRPERKPGGMEVKPLSSRLTCWREAMLDKAGNGPENLLR